MRNNFNRSKFWVCFSSVKIQLLIDNNKVGEMLSLKRVRLNSGSTSNRTDESNIEIKQP